MKPTPQEKTLLAKAARKPLAGLQADQAGAPPRLQELLRYLEEHLFETSLNVATWFRACGVPTSTGNPLVKQHLEVEPLAYLTALRMAAAEEMILSTDLEFWRISHLVGYEREQTFAAAFRRWSQLTPDEYRKKFRKEAVRTPRRHKEELPRIRSWRKVLLGGGSPEEQDRLAETLLRDYPSLRQCGGPGSDRRYSEEVKARKVWRKLSALDLSEQLHRVRLQAFESTALFDLLRKKSLEEGRLDRKRGVQLAELALASLDACAAALGEDRPNRQAQGWGCLANAQRLAEDSSRAERSFARAELDLAEAGVHRDPLVEAELHWQKALMRWYQRRHDEAMGLVERAIPVFRKFFDRRQLAQALILRGCIHVYTEAPKVAIRDILEGLELTEKTADPYLFLSGQSGLALAYRLLRNYEKGEEALEAAVALSQAVKSPVARHQILWASGLLKQERGDVPAAESYFRNAQMGLSEAGEMGYTAVVSMDLAILLLEQGSAEAVRVAAEALPALEVLDLHGEALAAVQLLADAIAVDEVAVEVLQKTRDLVADSLGPVPHRVRS
ncbi:MAG: helix-turn-helix transcriptional regulator [bacterium]|nr:helix-turn-helix transcriptional regulator [bacterium]